MSKTIEHLREHLFATLEGLRDESKPLDIDRAKAVAEVAGVIIQSAKVEVAYLQATGSDTGTSFLRPNDERQAALPNGISLGSISGVRTHRMQG